MKCWIDEMPGGGNVGGGMLEYWSVGVLECWSVGVLECWNVGVLECWNAGVLECWNVGMRPVGGGCFRVQFHAHFNPLDIDWIHNAQFGNGTGFSFLPAALRPSDSPVLRIPLVAFVAFLAFAPFAPVPDLGRRIVAALRLPIRERSVITIACRFPLEFPACMRDPFFEQNFLVSVCGFHYPQVPCAYRRLRFALRSDRPLEGEYRMSGRSDHRVIG
jgi:hypothetical protein